ncbi:MAG TPA: ABC transporter ATP-binding protein [Rubrivivax sp.]|nr:ABC transporter ATP-binding protein [Burkholderiales bacterium]HNT38192.1 ABC transporter ATP-binding protein [Rubrivivax sp.]
MLTITNLRVLYDGVVEGVRDVSLQVEPGRIVALLGSNGAGKSTTLKALSGVLYAEDGAITEGRITLDGEDLAAWAPQDIVRRGVVQVPEGRRLFDTLTVDENLDAGALARPSAAAARARERALALFPEIVPHRRRVAGLLSGGQQQMVAIARALMSEPRYLLLDEPSLGLAPQVIDVIFDAIRRLRDEGELAVLLVEQNARLALELADHGYVMDRGRIVLDGPSARLQANDDVREFYLGLGDAGERRSMREVKHYRRRKRWLS